MKSWLAAAGAAQFARVLPMREVSAMPPPAAMAGRRAAATPHAENGKLALPARRLPDRKRAVDLDLHRASEGTTQAFFTADDCDAETCRGGATPWDYSDTASRESRGGDYAQFGFCPNPRLAADNRIDASSAPKYLIETIGLRASAPADRFRVTVAYSTATPYEDVGAAPPLDAQRIVNVYCRGSCADRSEETPVQLGDREEVGLSYPGQMWRAADTVSSDGTCTVNPRVLPEVSFGYWVSGFDASYGD